MDLITDHHITHTSITLTVVMDLTQMGRIRMDTTTKDHLPLMAAHHLAIILTGMVLMVRKVMDLVHLNTGLTDPMVLVNIRLVHRTMTEEFLNTRRLMDLKGQVSMVDRILMVDLVDRILMVIMGNMDRILMDHKDRILINSRDRRQMGLSLLQGIIIDNLLLIKVIEVRRQAITKGHLIVMEMKGVHHQAIISKKEDRLLVIININNKKEVRLLVTISNNKRDRIIYRKSMPHTILKNSDTTGTLRFNTIITAINS